MDKRQFMSELAQYIDTSKIKVRFSPRSRFQANRYKEEYVSWEAWLYNGKSPHGFVITGDEWDTMDKRTTLDAFVH